MEISSALEFFRDVELMTIPDAPGRKDRQKTGWVVEARPGQDRAVPWAGCRSLAGDRVPYYLVHLGCAWKTDMVSHVVRSIGAPGGTDEGAFETFRGTAALGTVALDWKGRLIPASVQIASFALGTACLRTRQSLSAVQGAIARATYDLVSTYAESPTDAFGDEPVLEERAAALEASAAQEEAGKPEEALRLRRLAGKIRDTRLEVGSDPLVLDDLHDISRALADRAGLAGEVHVRIEDRGRAWRKEATVPRPPGRAPTSFLLAELGRMTREVDTETASAPLATFLTGRTTDTERIEVMREDAELSRIMAAGTLPSARWPAPCEHALSLGQQVGVAEALSGQPITAVNGPPGTGKTTLLRDIIANRIVERARRLAAEPDVSAVFEISEGVPVARSDLVEGTGIVVTSNSNAAVENVSRELPQASTIDAHVFADARYLPGLAGRIAEVFDEAGQPTWGVISAPMGKKSNTARVMRALRGTDADGRKTGADIHDMLRADMPPEADFEAEWSRARADLDNLTRIFRGMVSRRAQGAGDITRPDDLASIPDETSRHRLTLWTDGEMEELRGRIFLAALRIHELVLMGNAARIGSFVKVFAAILSGEEDGEGQDLVALWNTFFLVVPVVSTTFASMQSFPPDPGWIGDLLVDEAGQATPQSVLPGLSRARRAVIVGDPLQLEPITTLPREVADALVARAGLPRWLSPCESSVQTIADGTMRLGARIVADGAARWTGLPLRVHRRCCEPMFRISNEIAYAGQMVQADPGSEYERRRGFRSALGTSAWFDVSGPARGGTKVVTAEIEALAACLRPLQADGFFSGTEGRIIVVTPFVQVQVAAGKAVRAALGPDAARVDTGTIHKFQGREAEIVFLVLGSRNGPAGRRSRDWAGASPNMLNVAVSRAQRRLYVIGSFRDWRATPHFGDMAALFDRYGFVRPAPEASQAAEEILPGL